MSYRDTQKEYQILMKDHFFSEEAQRAGLYNDIPRAFCLHEDFKLENLYEPIRQPALDYFSRYGIRWHDNDKAKVKPSNHLCDSQVCCLNFLFPLRYDSEAVAELLKPVFPTLVKVLPMEDEGEYISFEWNGLTNYLHEKTMNGQRPRGEFSTSADAAVMFEHKDGSRQIVLIEWKYTESYTSQSKKISTYGTDRSILYAPFYEDRCSPIVSQVIPSFDDLFFDPFDQLMRQQFLAHEMEKAKELGASMVTVLHIAPESNQDFYEITSPGLIGLSKGTATKTWESFVKGNRFSSVYTEELFGEFPIDHFPGLGEWWDYINARYLLGMAE